MISIEDFLKDNPYKPDPENPHSVVIWFKYGLNEDDSMYNLGEEMAKKVEETKTGIYDGHEIAMDNSDGSYYLYGPNAETLFKAIKPILDKTPWMRGATAVLRFGPLDKESPEIEVEL
ncbi:MAG TPA: hypothetical protein VK177_02195 [Flavobacteriales bacterium]|nr:hypothetical protein [Flavobacteriales bacterium]